ncbi:MAG: hypothetical protein KKI15_20410 [Proteobacteria bacterium]|nr:hypothetical protein [Pseudomonadota bacterium]
MINDLVTIIGNSYFEPICTLLERLDRFKEHEKSDVQSGFYVNGFSVSICLLAVACLESYVMRVRFVRKASQKDIDKTPVVRYLPELYQDFPYTDDLNEIYILRDIIIHNHLWELGFVYNGNGMELTNANQKSSGDKKYLAHVDVNKRKTIKLDLTVNPIKVGKTEVLKVLQTMWKILIFLEKKDTNQCCVSAEHYRYKGEMKQFGEVVGMPKTCT